MERFKQIAAVMFFFVAGCGFTSPAQEPDPFRVGAPQLEQLAERMATHSYGFRLSFTEAIASSFLYDAPIGVYMDRFFVWEFDWLADRLRARLKDREPVSSEVQELLNRAEYIDTFMNSYDLAAQAESDWKWLRADLDQLAQFYRIRTLWHRPVIQGIPQPVEVEPLTNRLNGTYRLDRSESADVRDMVNHIAGDLPRQTRRRLRNLLVPRLKPPELLAIDRQGDRVTLASSSQPARSYTVAEGAETMQSERPATQLYGGQFRINQEGESGEFYSVIYNSIYLGSGLEVTRIVSLNQFRRPVVVVSRYRKLSDLPRLNIFAVE